MPGTRHLSLPSLVRKDHATLRDKIAGPFERRRHRSIRGVGVRMDLRFSIVSCFFIVYCQSRALGEQIEGVASAAVGGQHADERDGGVLVVAARHDDADELAGLVAGLVAGLLRRAVVSAVVGPVVGPVVGRVAGGVRGLLVGLVAGVVRGLLVGLVAGVVRGLLVGLVAGGVRGLVGGAVAGFVIRQP